LKRLSRLSRAIVLDGGLTMPSPLNRLEPGL